jgi:hypothetical protein
MLKLKRDEQITEAVEVVIAATAKMPAGSVVTWEFIEDVTGGFRERSHPKWTGFRSRLLKEFPKRRNGTRLMALPENRGGWTILTRDQQLKRLPELRGIRANLQHFRVVRAVSDIAPDGLSDAEQVHRARTILQHKQAMTAGRRALKTARSYELPEPQPNPRPKWA